MFQGEDKRAVVEIQPFRFDTGQQRLVLARKVVVRLSFAGREKRETGRGSHGRRQPPPAVVREVLAELFTSQRGLYSVAFEEAFPQRRRPIAAAELRLAGPFGDGAVIQRDVAFPVAGTATPGAKVVGEAGGRSHATTADAAGRFRVELPPMPAGGPLDLAITAGDERLLVDRSPGSVLSIRSGMHIRSLPDDKDRVFPS